MNDAIDKPKKLWKALKSIGLPSKTFGCEINAVKVKNTIFETKSTLEVFENYCSTLSIKKTLNPSKQISF